MAVETQCVFGGYRVVDRAWTRGADGWDEDFDVLDATVHPTPEAALESWPRDDAERAVLETLRDEFDMICAPPPGATQKLAALRAHRETNP